ncbi:MAG: bifunctional protein-serine/threonine kinase/phosphatase [Pseudomonadota bacterium]
MSSTLTVSVGQYSDRGRKAVNQDYHGIHIPPEPLLGTKGIAVALADGISSSEVSQIASQTAVNGFLADYFCTSEAWSVKQSAQRVLRATNSWLHAQTRQSRYRYDRDKGYVCTFSALILKSATAYLFHVGDTRIYRLRGAALEQLTEDHRYWVSRETSYLGRALGINEHLDIDHRVLVLEPGDIFVLMSDGVYEHVTGNEVVEAVAGHGQDLDAAAQTIVAAALAQGSADNLTLQLLRIDTLPEPAAGEICRQLTALPLPPQLDARMAFDGYRIVRQLHASSRSHAFLAVDDASGEQVVIKIPSIDQRGDPAYLERFLMEEWIARRISNAHVLKPCALTRKRNYQYIAMEYIEGQTLAQWLRDNPQPALETVRDIVVQIARGLQAFHRLEMLHQDLRPENIMIDTTGTVKIIDFGSTRVAGLAEMDATDGAAPILGTEQYSAPEYFLGENGTTRSDIFSLGVIAYQMLTGSLPYGTRVPRCRTRAAQRKLVYASARSARRPLPVWVDETIRKAVHPDPWRRYGELSEFVHDLQQPNPAFLRKSRPPLIERDPVLFWKTLTLCLAVALVVALCRHPAAA